MEESIQYAKKYLEDLLSFFGLNTEVHATTDEDNEVIILNVPSSQYNGFLIGQHGDTVRSIQFIVSNALKNNGYEVTRINVDIADYKKQRADRLTDTVVSKWAKSVLDSGEPFELRPMNSADRRIVHKAAEEAGVTTESIGEGRDRRVIIKPKEEAKKAKKPKKEDSEEE